MKRKYPFLTLTLLASAIMVNWAAGDPQLLLGITRVPAESTEVIGDSVRALVPSREVAGDSVQAVVDSARMASSLAPVAPISAGTAPDSIPLVFDSALAARGLIRTVPVPVRVAGDSTLAPHVPRRISQNVRLLPVPRADIGATRLIPVRKVSPGGVRIRSIRDSRPVIIVYPPSRGIQGWVSPPPSVDTTFKPAGVTRGDLERMEARLQAYLERRLSQLQEAQRESLRTMLSSAAKPVLVPGSPTVGRDVLLVPQPVPVVRPAAPERDTVFYGAAARPVPVDTMAKLPGAPGLDTAAVAIRELAIPEPTVPEPMLPLDTVSTPPVRVDIIEVERAILETGLLRAVNILFEANKATLLPASTQTLNALGSVLEEHTDLSIEIAGHTDTSGPEEYNLQLSQARAEAVRDYLLDNFMIDPTRLVARGYGESRPIAVETTATGRALNRRVEFVVLRSGKDVEAKDVPEEPEHP